MRIVHLGLGSFFRAHQAWYTAAAPEPARWRIAAFTGRSPAAADALNAQGGRYTLVVRGPEHDEAQVVGAVGAAYAGTDLSAWRTHLAAARTAVVTMTVTEAAYLRAPGGGLDVDHPEVEADLTAWRRGRGSAACPAG